MSESRGFAGDSPDTLREAKALLNAGFSDGAYYLAGYSVECALKACIAKATKRHDFPDKVRAQNSFTHNLKDLAGVARLESDLQRQAIENPALRRNRDLVQQWSEQSRYQRHNVDSSTALIKAIEDRKQGVMSWLRLHW